MGAHLGTIKDVVEISRVEAGELSLEWRIRNVLSLRGESEDFYQSPMIRLAGDSWQLRMRPNWKKETGNPASGWVSLGIVRNNVGPTKTFHIGVGIRGTGGVENRREGEKEFTEDDYNFLWEEFCSRSDLMEHKSRLMPDGVLNITCVIRSVAPGVARGSLSHPFTQVAPANRSQSSDKRDACCQTDCNLEAGKQSSEKRGCEKVHEDFAKLLAGCERSDVIVQVGDVEFKVHSVILFARSPALSVSLQHGSKEQASSRIVIEDCEPGVFRDFLHYIYAGSTRSLTVINAFGLYRLADKYLADDLKQQCLEHIQDTLCIQTFCEAVKLALTHGESGLLQKAVDFAAKNIQQILISVEWQNFICEYPREANEIFIKCFGPRS